MRPDPAIAPPATVIRPRPAPEPIKAYRVGACGIFAIVFSRTRGQARHATMRAARDAGWRVRFIEVSAYRAPEFDALREVHGRVRSLNTPFTPELLRAGPPTLTEW
jgi:hypothetical protein